MGRAAHTPRASRARTGQGAPSGSSASHGPDLFTADGAAHSQGESNGAALHALEMLAKKRVSYREVLKGVNILQRHGLLRAEAGGIQVRMRGSHIVCHGQNGVATLVRDHKSSRIRTGAVFLRDMSRLIDAV